MTKVLVVDIGGTGIKFGGTGRPKPVKSPSGRHTTPRDMVAALRETCARWRYDVVSVGYPGPVANGRPAEEPKNLGPGWVGFDYERAIGRPVRIVNDAAMQALGAYRGGRLLFLGLGTGLGTALVVEGILVPLELAHLPYRKGRTYEEYVGARGRRRLGDARWRHHVGKVIELLRHAMQARHVVVGGGAAKALRRLPRGVRRGTNAHAIAGGLRLWENPLRRGGPPLG